MRSNHTLRRFALLVRHLQPVRTGHAKAASSNSSGVRWLLPAGAGATRMEESHQKGVLHFPVCATVNTKAPLTTEQVEQTLIHLYRKLPPLRTCFRYREGVLWHCEKDSIKIDFKEVSGHDFIKELETLMKCLYTNSAEGPLWRVRLMRYPPEAPCPIPDAKYEFPYQCNFLISLHHGMTDGMTAFHVMEAFFMLLESVIGGYPIDDEQQLGKIVGDEQTLLMKQQIQEDFEKNPEELNKCLEGALQPNFVPLLYEAFGFPMDPNPATRFLISGLKTSTFEKFHERCTHADVTFNSGFTFAINTALVEMVRESGVCRDVYDVRSKHAVNLRRYWQKNRAWSFGCHIGRMSNVSGTPPFDKKMFWECAKKHDIRMQDKVKNKYVLKEEVAKEMYGIKPSSFEEGKIPLPVDCDYYISNAYQPSDNVISKGEHIHVTEVLCFIEMHLMEYMTFHLIASSPGRVTYTLSYSTWHITDENARKFLRKVESIVEELVA